ncbi:MAG: hypothetical protein ACYC27_07580 [Armatimonadota bacterium]
MRSSGDNVARSANTKAVRELGSDGMANTSELLINVVMVRQAKGVERLDQKVRGQEWGFPRYSIVDVAPPAKRQSLIRQGAD